MTGIVVRFAEGPGHYQATLDGETLEDTARAAAQVVARLMPHREVREVLVQRYDPAQPKTPFAYEARPEVAQAFWEAYRAAKNTAEEEHAPA